MDNNPKFEINKDNYEGYIELYKTRYIVPRKYFKKFLKETVITTIILSILLIATSSLPSIIPVILIFTALGSIIHFSYNMYKQTKKDVLKSYPYVDINTDYLQLEKELERVHILREEKKDGYVCNVLDTKGYENFLKCEEVKEVMLKECTYNNDIDYSISEEQMEKAKVKIKRLTR